MSDRLLTSEPETIVEALTHIRAGGVIAIPIENSYVFAADAFNRSAVESLHLIRDDPDEQAASVMVPSIISVRGLTASLSEEALMQVLVEPKNALVRQYERLFGLDNVELEITEDALRAVAELAHLRGTGARGLRAIMEEVLLKVMYDIPSRADIGKVVVNRDTVLDNVNPTLVPRKVVPEPEEKSA